MKIYYWTGGNPAKTQIFKLDVMASWYWQKGYDPKKSSCWKQYNKTLAEKLEKGLQRGQDKVRIDDER